MMSEVRLLIPADLDALHALEQACFAGSWSYQQLERQLAHPRGVNLGVWQGEQLAGFALFSTLLDEAELLQVGTAPEQQGKGVARRLLESAHQMLAKQDITSVLLEVRASNTPAISLYRKLNYAQVGERPNYYPPLAGQQEREAAYLFTLTLAAN